MKVKDLVSLVERDYKIQGRKSLQSMLWQAVPMLDLIGVSDISEITTKAVEEYKERRLGAGAARATINNELSILRRGFSLAVKQELVSRRPIIECLHVSNARQGFIEPEEFGRLSRALEALDGNVADVARWLYYLGWRKEEVLGLTWEDISISSGTVRLPAGRTKNEAPRAVKLPGELLDLLRRRWEDRDGPWVFHRRGKKIVDFRCIWRRVARAIGRPGLIPHDFRRSFARNAIQAGVAQRVIMEIGGWRTTAIFHRYAIVNEQQIETALKKIIDYSTGKRTIDAAGIKEKFFA